MVFPLQTNYDKTNSPLQGAEPEEANLPADSLLRPLRSARIHLGSAQKAHPLNPNPKPPAGPG